MWYAYFLLFVGIIIEAASSDFDYAQLPTKSISCTFLFGNSEQRESDNYSAASIFSNAAFSVCYHGDF
jgi:hypothetical protein